MADYVSKSSKNDDDEVSVHIRSLSDVHVQALASLVDDMVRNHPDIISAIANICRDEIRMALSAALETTKDG